jgi:hypothetical protein
MNYYIVYSKGDDYGKVKTDLVQVTKKIAEQYYHLIVVEDDDAKILSKYWDLLSTEEDAERTDIRSKKRNYA